MSTDALGTAFGAHRHGSVAEQRASGPRAGRSPA